MTPPFHLIINSKRNFRRIDRKALEFYIPMSKYSYAIEIGYLLTYHLLINLKQTMVNGRQCKFLIMFSIFFLKNKLVDKKVIFILCYQINRETLIKCICNIL